MGRTVLVVNPHSGNGKTGRELEMIRGRAKDILGDVDILLTQGPGHATKLTQEALDGGADTVVAVGGDGTNNEVINGFIRADGSSRNPAARFAFLPRGTGGDFRRTFGLGTDLDAALLRAKGLARATDVGILDYTAHDSSRGTRAYINIASAGLSGIVDQQVNSTSKALGPMSFFVGSLKGLMAYHPYHLKITVDGNVFHDGMAALCTAANGQYFGGGMRVAPAADPHDGLLDVTVLPEWSTTRFLAESGKLYVGDIRKATGVKTTRGKVVLMESNEDVLLDVDGEQPGRLPATFRVLPGAVQLCR